MGICVSKTRIHLLRLTVFVTRVDIDKSKPYFAVLSVSRVLRARCSNILNFGIISLDDLRTAIGGLWWLRSASKIFRFCLKKFFHRKNFSVKIFFVEKFFLLKKFFY